MQIYIPLDANSTSLHHYQSLNRIFDSVSTLYHDTFSIAIIDIDMNFKGTYFISLSICNVEHKSLNSSTCV